MVVALAVGANAQSFEAGIAFAGGIYSGDLSPKVLPRYFNFIEPMGGLVMRYRNNGVLGVRAGLTYGSLSGDDAESAYPDRKLSFETTMLEGSVVGEWHVIPDNIVGEPVLNPYFFLGIAVFHFSPETRYNSGVIALHPVGTEGQGLNGYEKPYSLTQLAIPFGAGLRLKAGLRSYVSLEICARKTFTDYLDDVTGEYLDYLRILAEKGDLAAELSRPTADPNNPTAQPNIYRRGGDRFDGYGTISLSYTYKLSR